MDQEDLCEHLYVRHVIDSKKTGREHRPEKPYKKWKRRWVVLSGNISPTQCCLNYCKKESDWLSKNHSEIIRCQLTNFSVQKFTGRGEHDNHLIISLHAYAICLAFESITKMDQWHRALERVLECYQVVVECQERRDLEGDHVIQFSSPGQLKVWGMDGQLQWEWSLQEVRRVHYHQTSDQLEIEVGTLVFRLFLTVKGTMKASREPHPQNTNSSTTRPPSPFPYAHGPVLRLHIRFFCERDELGTPEHCVCPGDCPPQTRLLLLQGPRLCVQSPFPETQSRGGSALGNKELPLAIKELAPPPPTSAPGDRWGGGGEYMQLRYLTENPMSEYVEICRDPTATPTVCPREGSVTPENADEGEYIHPQEYRVHSALPLRIDEEECNTTSMSLDSDDTLALARSASSCHVTYNHDTCGGEHIGLAELKKTRAASVGQNDLSKELAKSHQYTLQLEQQLKQYLTQAGSRDSSTPLRAGSALRPSSSPKTTSAEMERLKAKCKQLQTDLDRTKLTLGKNQEEFHIKESKLEASVAAAKKTIHELERTIEGMKLKNNTEKATLNEMHVNTIKSMLTPRWEGLHGNRSTSSTPLRQRLDSESMKDILQAHPTFNTPPKMGPLSPMETAIARDNGAEGKRCTVSVGVNTEVPMCHTPPPPPSLEDLVELNIEGALTDELKILQELERQVSREAQMKTSLSLQLEELTRLSSSEKDATLEREQLLLDKIAELSSNIASLTGTNAVQSGEILDLRLCLNSADRELTELKEEMKVLKHDQDTRLMEQTQRAADVEEQMGAKISEFERVTEELQCLQDEVDTLREELTFKEHGCRELEQALGREKEHVVSLETEVQSLLDRLAVEVEKSTCLSAELKEGSAEKQQLVATLDDNSRLASELQLLQSRLQNEEAFGALMVQLQELRATSSQHEDRIALSNKELEDSVLEMSRTSARLDEKSAQVEALQKRIAERDAIHEKELKSKDMERDLVGDELDHLTEQYQQISTAFETQTKDLLSAQDELERAAAIIGDYEKMREEKSKEMQLLKLGAEASEKLKWDYELLETNFKALQYKLSGQEEDHQHRVALLNGQIAALAAELGQLRSDQGNYMKLRDEAMMETQRLQLLCTSQRGSLEALTEEMGRQAVKTCVAIKQCENLAKENAAITGHHNLRQRIQYHAQTKMENNKLKEEVIQLQTQLKKKTERLHHMYKVLEERDLLGSGKFVAAAQLSSQRHTENTPVESEDSIKENVAPC
eukprot:Em0018g1013a